MKGMVVGYKAAAKIGNVWRYKSFNFAHYPNEEATLEAALAYRDEHRPSKRKRDDAEQPDDADEKPDLPQSKKQRVHEPAEKQA